MFVAHKKCKKCYKYKMLPPVNKHTEMKCKIYLSEAWVCSEFNYQRPVEIGLSLFWIARICKFHCL